MVLNAHLLKNFPQFVVIHTVKGFGVVGKAEVDVFLELSCFFSDPTDDGNLISGSSAFTSQTLRSLAVVPWISWMWCQPLGVKNVGKRPLMAELVSQS